jgi:hypothetical protein
VTEPGVAPGYLASAARGVPDWSLIRGESAVLPWFLPGVAVSVVLGLILGGRVGRVLRTNRALGTLLVLSVGVVVSATLTPLGRGFEGGAAAIQGCDLSRTWLPSLAELRGLNDASLNVLLFAPLGFSIALLPPSRRTLAVGVAAVALPFVIETTQMLAPVLHRGCESADVVDNLLGLALGVAAGLVARAAVAIAGRTPDAVPDPQ